MDLATEQTVLGDFNDAELTHHGITSRLFRRDGKHMVHTEGPDGAMQDFEIKYVFGVDPLQQFMVEFDRTDAVHENEIARLQVLRISWDTHKQEWFYLAPPDVDEKLAPDDDLHWTGIAQRWNNMCADCHSTNLKKNYDHQEKLYHTTFSEIDVSCETCHGPGSLHVELANSVSLFWDRKRGYGLADLKKSAKAEIETCAPCHSRRRMVHPDYHAGADYYDHYANELLEAHTYHADGQIMDEVYVYGSFLQSKMHQKNIRCTDCHDPHSARLKFTGNQVCTSCHQHPAGKYDSLAHHRHNTGSKGAQCVECHMPPTTYMAVDPRRDHSLRVPRPDLSLKADTPNACTGCHLEKAELSSEKREQFHEYAEWLTAARDGDPEVRAALEQVDRWAADHFRQWYGEKDDVDSHSAITLAAARRGDLTVEDDLIAVARNRTNSAIVRATSLLELTRFGTQDAVDAATRSLDDASPQVRMAAIGILQFLPEQSLAKLAVPMLDDQARGVRTEAARVLARVPRSVLRGPERQKLAAALEEYRAGVLVNNDRAAAHMTLGILSESLGATDDARRDYQMAIHVEPGVTGPRTNLAALFDRMAQEAQQQTVQLSRVDRQQAQHVFEQGMKYATEASRLRRQELDLLARDAKLAPNSGPILYRYGLSLYLHERLEEAETALRQAVELEPNTPDFSLAIALFLQKQGRFAEALPYAQQLLAIRPGDATYRNLYHDLRAGRTQQ